MLKKLSFAVIFSLLLLCFPFQAYSISQSQVNQAQAEYKAQQEQLEALRQQAQSTKQEILNLTGQEQALNTQLEQICAQLNQARQQADEARNLADSMERAYLAAQAEYEDFYHQSKAQLAAMQELHDRGGIALLGQVTNLYQLLTFGEVLQSMSDRDVLLLEELSRRAQELEERRRQAEDTASRAQAAADSLEEAQTQLDTLAQKLGEAIRESNSLLTQQEAEAQAQEAVTAQAKKDYLEALAQMDSYASQKGQQYTGAALHCSLDFRCPLNGGYYISCRYGIPDYKGYAHHGADLAAGKGTPIYAAADGIISMAACKNSYGNCVQISHGTAEDGRRYDTLYAHMSSFCVSEGQAVAKGEVIGYVGNTGDVTGKNGGYHLHLELRINGARTDPMTYIPV